MSYINNHFREKINAETVRENTLKAIERAKLKKTITDKIFAVMKKFDGKAITKRFETALKKELGEGFIVSLDRTGNSHMNIFVWQGSWNNDVLLTYSNRLMVFVGYMGSNQYDKQIETYQNSLKKLGTLVDAYNAQLAKLEEAQNALNALALNDWE